MHGTPSSFAHNTKCFGSAIPAPLPVHALDGCPETRIPLATLRGKQDVELLACDAVWLTDSPYVRQFLDGPLPGRIEAISHPMPVHYRLRIVGPSYSEPGMLMDFRIIDPVRQIAAIVFRTGTEYALLYGSLERIDLFDVVDRDFTEPPAGDGIPWNETDYLALVREPACGGATDCRDNTGHDRATVHEEMTS